LVGRTRNTLLSRERSASHIDLRLSRHAGPGPHRKSRDAASGCSKHRHPVSNVRCDSYTSSLWAIDYLFNCAQGGASGVNFHGGGNGSGYTPIADSSGSVVGARQEYYGILMFALAGQGTLYQTQVAAGILNVTAYAVKPAGGGLTLVIVNKDPTQNVQLTLTLPQSATSATVFAMTQLTRTPDRCVHDP
jgi:hypothetical protein